MNRYLTIFLLFLLLGCHKNQKGNSLENIQSGSHYGEKQIKATVRQLIDSNKSDQALKLIDTLISHNKQNGYLYFERGFVEGYKFHHGEAIKDYKIAESLHYNKTECQFMIQISQKAINEKNK
jgi:hypothetical protein